MSDFAPAKNLGRLREFPAVVAPIVGLEALRSLGGKSLQECCDFVELRLDTLTGAGDGEIGAALGGLPLPAILTARRADEGGEGDLGPAEREELLIRHLGAPVAMVDIEVRSLAEMGGAIEAARGHGAALLASFHDFAKAPPAGELDAIIAKAAEAGAEACKIAVRLDTVEDLFSLAQLTREESRLPLSAMGMGPLGKVSRLLLAQCGSILNYGFLESANAEGQWPAAQLKDLIAEFADLR